MSNHTTLETGKAFLQDVDKLKRNAVQVVEDVREHANAHVNETRQRVGNTIKSVQDNLVAQPLYLVGIGFAVGLVLGWRLRG